VTDVSRSRQITPQDLAGRRVLVMGLGLLAGGAGVVRYCARHGAIVRITDLRDPQNLGPTLKSLSDVEFELTLGRHDLADFDWAEVVFRNPAVGEDNKFLQYARDMGKIIEMEVPFFLDNLSGSVYGITGTKGKTTTASVLHHILESAGVSAKLSGNMGIPAIDLLDSAEPIDQVVLEVSSYQIEGLRRSTKRPHVVVITNVHEDHLDRYGSIEAYRRVKASLAIGQNPEDWLVIPGDDRQLLEACSSGHGKRVLVLPPGGSQSGQTSEAESIVETSEETVAWRDLRTGRQCRLADLNDSPLRGAHNRMNVAMAAAAAYAGGCAASSIAATIGSLRPVPHRMEFLGWVGSTSFINDTAATAPVAVKAALESLTGERMVLVVGGVDKGMDYSDLFQSLQAMRIPLVLLPGSATDKLTALIAKHGYEARTVLADDMGDAVANAFTLSTMLPPPRTVLLSPGAASFGLFRNEFDRGEQFRAAVQRVALAKGLALRQHYA
jgi:UDP-N-acetylmuramoylalanine--D-glutamate ligase